MRKKYKDKRASCPLCKPYKRKWSNRWKVRDLDFIGRSEKEIRAVREIRLGPANESAKTFPAVLPKGVGQFERSDIITE